MTEDDIRVLVVDDSAVATLVLVRILQTDPRIKVVGTVTDGRTAVEFVRMHRPDLVLMDFHMPRMDGSEATKSIMQTHPVPVVICSGVSDPREMLTTFRVLESGAVACVAKPVGTGTVDDGRKIANLLQTVKLMSEVKVVRHWPARASGLAPVLPLPVNSILAEAGKHRFKAIGIGASTGGPAVIKEIVSALPGSYPIPVLVVQHITPGFAAGLAEWLGKESRLRVQLAVDGQSAQPGTVYVAPDSKHLALTGGGLLSVNEAPPENGLRPSVSHLFRSLADVCGSDTIGVLLTGMGKDGAAELRRMRDMGAVTLVQDKETCVVNGMPGEATSLGAAMYVLPPEGIAAALVVLANQTGKREVTT
ncbi:chemotaxis-specific protein-glutamate methyltransferase CheB [Verrucomicrobium sp. BvORR106]|uniref:chemotaxis-specific protein-glutamate methyltransferase CheB n=1 Tax=Verrucomicrobium sp. BvORR106 TaxID=1403819 RepID=UPI0005717EED|nr:chemotaxis-specific protein-glutamate methyltransferase CheB [Verrucomicrobium sp. BvORR106]